MKTRAAVLHDVGEPWSVEEIVLDAPHAGEVAVKMTAAGLCHSDDHIRKGDMSAPNDVLKSLGLPTMFPMVGGHEGAGVVVETGPGVTRVAVGDHVVMSFVPSCGSCRFCAEGMQYLCDLGALTMTPGMPTDGTFRHHTTDGRPLGHLSNIGAFAEHTVVSVDSVVKIDGDAPLVPAALLSCSIPTGFGSMVHRAKVAPGDTVVVMGAGGIGTGAIQGARIGGARNIVAIDPDPFKRESAKRFGATHTAVSTKDARVILDEITRGVMADGVVVAPSLIGEDTVRKALSLTRKAGTCVLTGMAAQTTRAVQFDLQDFILMNKNLAGTVFGSCNPQSDIPMMLGLYRSGLLQLDEMITRRYRLDDINDAYDDLLAHKLVRGVVVFD